MTEKTKPCPFCGGHAEFVPDSAIAFTVRCVDCGAQLCACDIPSYTTDRNWLPKMKAEMIAAWNKRDDPSVARLNRIAAAAQRLADAKGRYHSERAMVALLAELKGPE